MDFQDLNLFTARINSISFQMHYFQKYVNTFLIHNTFPHFNDTFVLNFS
jgi:hypothetical protein